MAKWKNLVKKSLEVALVLLFISFAGIFFLSQDADVYATTYTCVSIDENFDNASDQYVDSGTVTLVQHVRTQHSRSVRQGPQENAWIIKETRAWWTRSSKGVSENWHPDNARMHEMLVGYECTNQNNDYVISNWSAYFTPAWFTNERTYDYTWKTISTYPHVVPIAFCYGGLRTRSAVNSKVYQGSQQMTVDWYTTNDYFC